MSREVSLDVRGLEPPEPIVKVFEVIDDFGSGDKLRLVIDCHPVPLFRLLEKSGFAWRQDPGTDSIYEITIWRAG